MDLGNPGRLQQSAAGGQGYRLSFGQKRDPVGGGRRLPVFGLPALLVFAIEPDRAGRSVFTIDLWVPAFQTIFA